MPLTSIVFPGFLVQYHVSTSTAIWSGNFLAFYNNWEDNWSGSGNSFVLFWCYSCVYNTTETMKVLFTDTVNTTAELDLLISTLSPLL